MARQLLPIACNVCPKEQLAICILPLQTFESIAEASATLRQGSLARLSIFTGCSLGCLVALLYAPVLRDLALQWWQDPDYGHGFVVPLIAGYAVWRNRERYLALQPRPANSGMVILLGSVALLVAGTLAAEQFTARLSLLTLIAGILVFLAGWKALRAAAFPLGYLVCMIPLPGIVFNQITFSLQLVASSLAERVLRLLGLPVLREGNLLIVPNYRVEIVQACSGIRSLLSLIAVAAAFLYFVRRPWWARAIFAACLVPVAVGSNAVRIAGTTVLGYLFGQEWADGFFHLFSGWLIFVTALILLLTVDAVLGRVDRARRITGA